MFTDYAQERMQICKACEHFNNMVKTCKICGCFMPAKTSFRDQECPDTPPRWTKLEYSRYKASDCCRENT